MIRIDVNHEGNKATLDTNGADIELSIEYQDAPNLRNRNSPYSVHFLLPFSNTNNAFFGHYYNVNYTTSDFSPYIKTKAELYDAGWKVFDGYIELTEVNIVNHTYEVIFLSEVANVFDKFKSTTWRDALGTDLDHEMSATNVVNSWQISNDITNGGVGGGVVVYALKDGAQFAAYGENGSGPLWALGNGLGVHDSDTPIEPSTLAMTVKVSWLINRLFNQAGYIVSSDFLTNLGALYCTIGFNNNQLVGRPSQYTKIGLSADYTITSSAPYLIQFNNGSSPFSNPDGLFVQSQFTAPVTGTYNFMFVLRYVWSITPSGSCMSRVYAVDSNGGYLAMHSQVIPYPSSLPNQGTHLGYINVALQVGQVIEFHGKVSQYGSSTLSLPVLQTDDVNGNPSFVALNNQSTVYDGNSFVDVPANFSSETVYEWIQEIITRYNLYVWPDSNYINVLKLETYDKYIDEYTNTHDWSNKVDFGNDLVIKPMSELHSRSILFADKPSTNYKDYLHTSNNNVPYGGYEFINPNEFIDGEQSIGNYFSPIRLTHKRTYNWYNEVPDELLLLAYTQEWKHSKGGEVLAYYHGTQFTTNLMQWQIGNQSTSLYPLFTAWSDAPVQSDSVCTHFASNGQHDYPDHPLINIQNSTADFSSAYTYHKYWSRFINEMYSDDARYMSCNMRLTANDLYQLQWNDRVFIKDAYWRIWKINGVTLTGKQLAQVELIKVVPKDSDCTLAILEFAPTGLVVFDDGTGNPATATEACCSEWGFEWNDNNCWWSNQEGNNNGDTPTPNVPTGIDSGLIDSGIGFTDSTDVTTPDVGVTNGTFILSAIVGASDTDLNTGNEETEIALSADTQYQFSYNVIATVLTGANVGETSTAGGVIAVSTFNQSSAVSAYTNTIYEDTTGTYRSAPSFTFNGMSITAVAPAYASGDVQYVMTLNVTAVNTDSYFLTTQVLSVDLLALQDSLTNQLIYQNGDGITV